MVCTVIVIVVVCVVTALYAIAKRKHSYWQRNGVPFIKPEFPYGNFKGFGKTVQPSLMIADLYNQFKNRGLFGGAYFFFSPFVIPVDLDMVKTIMLTDFQYFQDRGLYFNEKDDPLFANLFTIEGEKWRKLRAKLTSTFTSGKMKFMYPTLIEVAERFDNCLSELIRNENGDLEIKELLSRFTTDIIGTCAFGIECNSLKDPNAAFRTMGRKAFTTTKTSALLLFLLRSFPKTGRKLGITVLENKVSEFFLNIVSETVRYREANNIHRNDFLDILIKLKNEANEEGDMLTMNQVAAQVFLFFFAGFETSSTTMTFALYELARNLDIQNKVRQEIKDVLEKHNGKFSYEAMMEMKYVDQVINETLRKHPPLGHLVRIVTKDYHVPQNNIVWPKGTSVMISAYGIHHDADIYPNPEEFDPDRFLPEEMAKRHNMAFIPFGEGPRTCIGLRFGMMQTRVGLVMLLLNYEFTLCSRTMDPIVIAPTSLIRSPEGGIWLNLRKLKK